jgi:hypothetical protein
LGEDHPLAKTGHVALKSEGNLKEGSGLQDFELNNLAQLSITTDWPDFPNTLLGLVYGDSTFQKSTRII